MKFIFSKKENSKKAYLAELKQSRGFALLFSVLLSSLLLTIGLSIFSIALKELAISTAARQSIFAFYAADSGREYVLYRDTKKGDLLPFDVLRSSDYSTSTTVTGIVDPINDSPGPNYSTTLTKQWFDPSRLQISDTIISNGFDSSSGDRVGRQIREDY